MNKIEGYLYYTCIQDPVDCYDKDKGKEWKVSVLVDRDTFDDFTSYYSKTSTKKVNQADFESEYKTAVPEEFEGEKFLYIINLRKNTMLSNGKPVLEKYFPRVLQRKGKAVVDVTQDILVGNGSKGAVSIEEYTSSKYPGKFGRLLNVLVTDLVPYEGATGNTDPVFGEFETAPEPGSEFNETPEQEEAPKSTKAKNRKAKVADEEDPFN